MDDAATTDLEEFKQLRAEIVNRTTIGHQLASFAMTAFAAAFAISGSYPDALLGSAVLICALWLLWIDNTACAFKVGAYIALGLAPRLQRRVGDHLVMGWESFVRQVNAGGP